MAKVEIYTRDWCGYCARAKNLLRERGAEFAEYDVGSDADLRTAMVTRTGGPSSVPQIFIDDHHIGGCDDLLTLDRSGGLEPLLAS